MSLYDEWKLAREARIKYLAMAHEKAVAEECKRMDTQFYDRAVGGHDHLVVVTGSATTQELYDHLRDSEYSKSFEHLGVKQYHNSLEIRFDDRMRPRDEPPKVEEDDADIHE